MLLFGQLASAMLISHFGLLGSPVQPINMTNALGAVLLFVGAVLATRAS
jgi:transporter family-2 protein